MRTLLRTLSVALLLTATGLSAQPVEGTWTISQGRSDGRLQLQLQWNSSTWGRGIASSDFDGLSADRLAATGPTPVSFRLPREAGVFHLEGTFREGRGTGHFRFEPDPSFAAALRSLGVSGSERVDDATLLRLAYAGTTLERVREFTRLGFEPLTVAGLVELGIHEITPEYVRSIRTLGIDGTGTVRGVVEMWIHRITPAFVRSLEAEGYGGLSRRELLQMGIHRVTPEFIREMRQAGLTDVPARQLVELRIHRVTPEYIREMRAAGLGELTPAALVELRIHRISADYVLELGSLGYSGLSHRQLLQMGIHGVTPALIRELREAGYTDLPAETLIRMRIHGVDRDLVRDGRARGS
jgi:hypothetical protein